MTIFLEPPEATLVWEFLRERQFTRLMREWMGVDFPYWVSPNEMICVYFEGDAWRPWLPVFFVIMEYDAPRFSEDTADMDFMAALPCPPTTIHGTEVWSIEEQQKMLDLIEACLRPPTKVKLDRPPIIPPDDGPEPD